MQKYLAFSLLVGGSALLPTEQTTFAAELQEATDLKFALYSSAWGENTDDGLRLVALNQTGNEIHLYSITILGLNPEVPGIEINFELPIPALRYADAEIDYIDLLGNDECIERTMAENWKLVEISNYTLNPSVRNLIIENTDSFRIYQCVRSVLTKWVDLSSNEEHEQEEWILYHFETRREN